HLSIVACAEDKESIRGAPVAMKPSVHPDKIALSSCAQKRKAGLHQRKGGASKEREEFSRTKPSTPTGFDGVDECLGARARHHPELNRLARRSAESERERIGIERRIEAEGGLAFASANLKGLGLASTWAQLNTARKGLRFGAQLEGGDGEG